MSLNPATMSNESRIATLESRAIVVHQRIATLYLLFAPLIANFPRGAAIVDAFASPLYKELRDIALEWDSINGNL